MKVTPNGELRGKGSVKWFDVTKGFGFLEVVGMSEEILLHVSTLRDYGLSSISKGASVEFDYEFTDKGIRVTGIVGISRDQAAFTASMLTDQEVENLQPAAVKWFDTARGFGFVTLFGTNKEVFLHTAALQASEITEVFPGLAVAVLIEVDGKKAQVKHLFPWINAGDPTSKLG